MKKYIYTFFILLSTLLLVSCGSNSKRDPIAPVAPVANNTSFTFSNVDTPIVIDTYKQYSIGFKLNKDGYGFSGGEVRVKSFDAKYGTIANEVITTDENGRGVFTYSPPEEMPKSGTSYVIQFTYLVTLEDKSTVELAQYVTLKFNLKKSDTKQSHYYFSNTPKVLTIESNKKYDIGFQLNKDKFGLDGATVKMRSFDARYGSIEDAVITTDKNGKGIFVYLPPKEMPKSGTSYVIQFIYIITLEDKSTQELIENVTLKFNLKKSDIKQSYYYFSNTQDVLTIESNKKYDIGFQLNKDKFGFGGATVKMRSFDARYGSIEEEVITTDKNGKGVFVYSPPAKMPSNGTTYKIQYVYQYTTSDGKKEELIQSLRLKFDIKPDTQTQDKYYFNEVTDNVLVDSYKQYVLKFKLNLNNFVVDGATVKMRTFSSKYGTVESATAVTDENGRAIFTYAPPKDMPKAGTTYTIQYVYAYVTKSGEKKELVQNVKLTFKFDPNNDGNGRATNLSISYKTTTCNEKEGIIEHFSVHATDVNSRKPVVGVHVSFSLISGVRVLQGTKLQRAKGTIKAGNPIKFSDNAANFNKNIHVDDNLIILSTKGRSDMSYAGGWGINDVSKDLQLNGNYNNIKTTGGLTYIVGNEKRLLGGDNGSAGKQSAIHVKAINAETDQDGFAYFDLLVDPILGGHTVTVEAHGNENGRRFGVAQTEFLRTSDFTAASVVFPNAGGSRDIYMAPRIIPGCVGDQPLIDVPTGNYEVSPSDHCYISASNSNFHTDGNGHARIHVVMDGNVTAAKECTVSWRGGSISVGHEY